MKLSVGLAKKMGLPDYGSIGAHCDLDFEVDADLLREHPHLFRQQVRQAYVACSQAVLDELARQRGITTDASPTGTNIVETTGGPRQIKKATPKQVRALERIAEERRMDLQGLMEQRFRVVSPAELSVRQASLLIEELVHPEGGSPGSLGRKGSFSREAGSS